MIEHNETLAYLLGVPTLAAVLGVLIAVVVILVRRWRAASPPLRRVLAPVYLSSGATVVILVVETALAPFSGFGADVFEWLSVVALSTVPLSFLGGLMRTRLARTAVADLMTSSGRLRRREPSPVPRARPRRPIARARLLGARW